MLTKMKKTYNNRTRAYIAKDTKEDDKTREQKRDLKECIQRRLGRTHYYVNNENNLCYACIEDIPEIKLFVRIVGGIHKLFATYDTDETKIVPIIDGWATIGSILSDIEKYKYWITPNDSY